MEKSVNLTPYKKSLSLMVQKASGLTIKTEEQIKDASDILFQISEIAKKIKAEKNRIVEPAKDIIAWAKEKFGPIEKECVDAEFIIKDKMIEFDRKKSELAAKQQEKIAAKVAEGKMDLEQAAEKMEATKTPKSYAGEAGVVQFRPNKVVEVVDEKLIPREFLVPDMVKIRRTVLAGIEVPGVIMKIEKVVAKGGAPFKRFISDTEGNPT